MCSTITPERKHPKKSDHQCVSSPRSSARAGSSVPSRFNGLIPRLRLCVSRFALVIGSGLEFLPARPPLLLLVAFALALALGIDARTSRGAVVGVAATFTTAVDLDAASAAGDTVALASALRVRRARVAEAGQRRWRRAVRAAGRQARAHG